MALFKILKKKGGENNYINSFFESIEERRKLILRRIKARLKKVVKLIVCATTGKYSEQADPGLSLLESLERWEEDELH